jgi:cell division protein FtsB
MNNEELLQEVVNTTLERFGKQSVIYETEIANLNAKIIILNDQVKNLNDSLEKLQTTEDS